MRNAVHGLYKRAAEAVLPPLSVSQFEDKRVLTPQEFVESGDYLVRACPTWSWEGGEPKKRKSYLPPNKQYLVTRNVPSQRRARDLAYSSAGEEEVAVGEGEEQWVATHGPPGAAGAAGGASQGGGGGADIPTLDSAGSRSSDADHVPDIADLDLQEEEEEDDEAAAPIGGGGGGGGARGAYLTAREPEDTVVRTRTYDLAITYDQYYQVPRFWLAGYDESRRPLSAQQILEDVSEEHARKTITVEPHPHAPHQAASIHPCKHAQVMTRLVEGLTQGGRSFAVHDYLILFLKFIAGVVPTIEYDYTMAYGGS